LLIVSQVAFSFLLLIGAGLMLRSFMKLQHVDPGFEPENVLTMRIGLNFKKYDTNEKQQAFFEKLMDKAAGQSGVKSAAMTMTVPLGDAAAMRMAGDLMIEGQTVSPGQAMPIGEFRFVSPSYFDTLHIPLLAGREFAKSDRPNTPFVAILSQSAARHIWGGTDPIGKRFSPDMGENWVQVIGVVGDIHEYGLDKKPADAIYVSIGQQAMGDGSLIVKTAGDPMSIAKRVIELIYEIDPNQPAARIRSLEQVRAESMAGPRLTANLLGIFAGLALTIAAAGIGGVMALVVNQRKHEIGVRMAIGARPGSILRMVLSQGLALALAGIALGLVGALSLTRVLQGLLFEIQPTDPMTFVGVAVVLSLAALAACYIPARRAARVDPIVALRAE
jgi:predicted permease